MIFINAYSQTKDTVYMNNGAILVGELKSIALGKMEFDANDLSILNVKLSKVKTIKAATHIYRLETIDKQEFFTILDSAEAGQILIQRDTVLGSLFLDQILKLFPLQGETGSYLEAKASAGYSYTRSSKIGRLNSDLHLDYLTKKFEVISSGSVILTQTDTSSEVDNAGAGVAVSYLFNAVWEASFFLNYQRNLEQGLSRRYQEGLGGGIKFISTEHIRTKAISGLVFSQEKSVEDLEVATQVEFPLLIGFSYFSFSKPDMTIDVTQSLFTGITQWGRFRQEGKINVSVKIVKDLYVNVQLYDNFDNQPPGENAAKFDYGIVFGLTFKFSQ